MPNTDRYDFIRKAKKGENGGKQQHTLSWDCALGSRNIGLVSYQDKRDIFAADLLGHFDKLWDFLKRRELIDTVDKNEAVAVGHIVLAHGRVFFLAGGIEDFKLVRFAVDVAFGAVGIFDCGVVHLVLVESVS